MLNGKKPQTTITNDLCRKRSCKRLHLQRWWELKVSVHNFGKKHLTNTKMKYKVSEIKCSSCKELSSKLRIFFTILIMTANNQSVCLHEVIYLAERIFVEHLTRLIGTHSHSTLYLFCLVDTRKSLENFHSGHKNIM